MAAAGNSSGNSSSGANTASNLLERIREIALFDKFNNSKDPAGSLKMIQVRLDNMIRTNGDPDTIKLFIDYIDSKDRSILNDPTFAFLATACVAINFRGEETDAPANIAKKLLDLGVDVNIPNRDGNTPLMHAALSIDTALVTRLINRGANLDAVNNEGKSALIRVCSMFANVDIYDTKYLHKLAQHALLLIKKGANIHIKNEDNLNAMNYATNALDMGKPYSQDVVDALGKAAAASASASIPPARPHASAAPRPAASAVIRRAKYTELNPELAAALQVPGLSTRLSKNAKEITEEITKKIQLNADVHLGGVRRKTHRRKNRKQTKRKRTRS